MKLFDLKPAMHPQTIQLDTGTLVWAWRNKMFEDYGTFEKVRRRTNNLLVGFLFPDGEVNELQLIMRFSLTKDLFLDYYDQRPEQEFIAVVKAIQRQDLTGLTGTIGNVCENLIQLSKVCSLHFAVSNWQQNWDDYLEGLIDAEEFFLSGSGKLEDLDNYEYNRITGLGVWLMFGMVRHPYRDKYEVTSELELAIGKMIQFVADRDFGTDLLSQNCLHPLKYKMVIDYYPGEEGLQCFFDAEYLAELGADASDIGYEIVEEHRELESWVCDAFQVMAGWFNWNYYTKCSDSFLRI
ncbi:hypothetical protein [Algoriphagus terrigena]|uniref:hypothetical protein n=1 Tax=Algoriphagus terrigena TaxID=344884 RepID=UPI0012FBC070|nr:hypothetical protein [Algoriphagus terrigena]